MNLEAWLLDECRGKLEDMTWTIRNGDSVIHTWPWIGVKGNQLYGPDEPLEIVDTYTGDEVWLYADEMPVAQIDLAGWLELGAELRITYDDDAVFFDAWFLGVDLAFRSAKIGHLRTPRAGNSWRTYSTSCAHWPFLVNACASQNGYKRDSLSLSATLK